MSQPDAKLELSPGSEALSDALRVSLRLLRWMMVFLILGYFASGIFVVKQDEKAFVLLFGKVHGVGADKIKGPGLHWTWPRPISEIVKVASERERTVSSNRFWYYEGPGASQGQYGALIPGRDGYCLTGDGNIIHARWALRYTVSDPQAFAFGFDEMDAIVQRSLERAVLHATSRRTVDQALRTDIGSLQASVQSRVRNALESLGTGISVQGVDLIDLEPPGQVKPMFDAVTQSANLAAQLVFDAEAYQVKLQNETRGEVERIKFSGESDVQEMLASIEADAAYFEEILVQYATHPEITLDSLRQETLRKVLAQVDEKHIIYSREAARELRLQISKRPKKLPGIGDNN